MRRSIGRRTFLRSSLAAAAALSTQSWPHIAHAQTWPDRPIRIVVGFPAGGITDVFARAYGDAISQALGQPVVVENRAGAGGLVAGEFVAKAPPDGYTLLFTIQAALLQSQALYKKLPFDPARDYTFIAAFGNGHLPCAVPKDLDVKTFGDFVALAKKQPVNVGSFAPGSYAHLVISQLNKLYGTRIEAVHFKGEAPMWPEVVAGRLHGAIGSYGGVNPHLQSGGVRVIAVPTLTRSPKLPEVPTYAEQGYREPIFTMRGWLGLLGPAGMPAPIVETLSKQILAALDTPRVKQLHDTFGIPDKPTTPTEFVRLVRDDGPVWIAMTKELGLTLD